MKEQLRSIGRSQKFQFAILAFTALSITLAGLTFLSRASAQEKTDFTSEIATVIPGPPQSVAFASSRDGNNEIYVMNADGSTQTRITNTPSNDQRPEISPDGGQIVFASNRVGAHFEIFIMNTDGSNVRQLTTFGSSAIGNTWPRWSFDGEWIAFQSGGGSDFQIYRIRPDGNDLTQVTHYAGLNQFPAWSPDGMRLVIRRNNDIYLIDSLDGSNPVRLTDQGTVNQMASWSSDGTQIAFLSNRAGYNSVFLMKSDGSDQVNFTPKPSDYTGTWTSRAPAWSPNGQFIYFTGVRSLSDTGSTEEIFVKPVEGGDETKLTTAGANVEATVRRVHAPTIEDITASPNVLWPPKNQMVPVTLSLNVADNSDPSPVCQITDVTSNEEIFEPAWEITGPLALDLRAQRYGILTGRVYTINVTCTNTSQLSSTAAVTVSVPHDQGKRAVDLRASLVN